MGHRLALDLSDEIFDSLAEEAKKMGRSTEDLATRLLAIAVLKVPDDPLESFIGAFDSHGGDWMERHNEYLGQFAVKEGESLSLGNTQAIPGQRLELGGLFELRANASAGNSQSLDPRSSF